jgi:hypothetical protein
LRRVGAQYVLERMKNLVKRNPRQKGKEWSIIEQFHWTLVWFISVLAVALSSSCSYLFSRQDFSFSCCVLLPHFSSVYSFSLGFCCLQPKNFDSASNMVSRLEQEKIDMTPLRNEEAKCTDPSSTLLQAT